MALAVARLGILEGIAGNAHHARSYPGTRRCYMRSGASIPIRSRQRRDDVAGRRAKREDGTTPAPSRAPAGGGRSGGSRRRPGSRTSGSRAARDVSVASPDDLGKPREPLHEARPPAPSAAVGSARERGAPRRCGGSRRCGRGRTARSRRGSSGSAPQRGRRRPRSLGRARGRGRYQRAASTPISSTKSSRNTTSPRRLDIFVARAALGQVDELGHRQHLDRIPRIGRASRRAPARRAT